MVLYCCVKGCGNNTNKNKKNPSTGVSFHAFPSNSELKLKWLRAIGRPNWDPPNHIRICSVHFNFDQISHDRVRTRILDQACPVNALPPNSNFEASDIEVCRICLATDMKLYTLDDGMLKTCIESIAGFNETLSIDGLPQFVCYECAAYLTKCYKLVERSMVAQATLLDIFAQNGKITKCLVNIQNRKKLNLTSTLSHNTTPAPLYKFQYNVQSLCNFETGCDENYDSIEVFKNHEDGVKNHFEEFNVLEETSFCKMENEKAFKIEETNSINDEHIDSVSDIGTPIEELADENKVQKESITQEKKTQHNVKTKLRSRKRVDGLTPKEINIQENFEIVKLLSLQEQITEWKKSVEMKNYVHQCEICFKCFLHDNTYRIHLSGHDPSRGKAECPVCKLRFKSASHAMSHAKYTHTNKFHCKSCQRVFNSLTAAKKHYKCRGGHAHAHRGALACARCGRPSGTRSALLLHEAVAHRGRVETEGSQEFSCEECGLGFQSEGARRVHLLSASHHGNATTLLKHPAPAAAPRDVPPQPPPATARPPARRKRHSLPDDNYPKHCDHCDVMLHNRKEHWSHFQQRHRCERAAYRPVVRAVCDVCGKGFQNATKLRIHELRHGSPAVRCELCPKVFYDKFRLAGHLAAHSDARPHRCGTCGRGFKLRGNLDRHYRVHTDEAAYECALCAKRFKYSTSLNLHVRTVHHKVPPPPRRKRAKPTGGHTGQIE